MASRNQKFNDKAVFRLARDAALSVQGAFPDLFATLPIRTTMIAKRFGCSVISDPTIPFDGRYLSPSKDLFDDFAGIITFRPGLSAPRGRFVIAHELAHAWLAKSALVLAPGSEEEFANTFARELIVPMHARNELRAMVRTCSGVLEFLRLCNWTGLNPGDLLTFLYAQDRWLDSTQRAIIQFKFRENSEGSSKLNMDQIRDGLSIKSKLLRQESQFSRLLVTALPEAMKRKFRGIDVSDNSQVAINALIQNVLNRYIEHGSPGTHKKGPMTFESLSAAKAARRQEVESEFPQEVARTSLAWRVTTAIGDSHSIFIPKNKRLESLFPAIDIAKLLEGCFMDKGHVAAALQTHTANKDKPRWRSATIPCDLSAAGLAAEGNSGLQILAVILWNYPQ